MDDFKSRTIRIIIDFYQHLLPVFVWRMHNKVIMPLEFTKLMVPLWILPSLREM